MAATAAGPPASAIRCAAVGPLAAAAAMACRSFWASDASVASADDVSAFTAPHSLCSSMTMANWL